jgi:hypothetical protein
VPQFGRRFVLRVPPEQAQHNGVAEVERQSGKFLIEDPELVAQIAGSVRPLDRSRFGRCGFVVRSAPCRAPQLPGYSTGNTHQPPRHRRRGTRGPKARREDEKNGLKRILGRARSDEPVADAVHDRSVPVDEFGKRVFVPGACEPGEEFAVGDIRCGAGGVSEQREQSSHPWPSEFEVSSEV